MELQSRDVLVGLIALDHEIIDLRVVLRKNSPSVSLRRSKGMHHSLQGAFLKRFQSLLPLGIAFLEPAGSVR